MKKIVRQQKELAEELKEQLSLLNDAIQKVNSGDFKYSKTLASILRILVIKTPSNKPLLLNTAQNYNYEPKVIIDSPFGIKTIPLEQHLKDIYFASGTEKVSMSNEEFIKIASQQDGGAHVDSEIDFGYQFANNGILIGGLPPKILKLRILASHVLRAGNKLLSVIESREQNGL